MNILDIEEDPNFDEAHELQVAEEEEAIEEDRRDRITMGLDEGDSLLDNFDDEDDDILYDPEEDDDYGWDDDEDDEDDDTE